MEQYAIYAGVHRVRRNWRGPSGRVLEVKPEAEILEGQRLTVMAAWQIEDDDTRYPGEWAMTPPTRYPEDPAWEAAGLAWIASGDFESLEYVGPYGSQDKALALDVIREYPPVDRTSRLRE